MTNMPHFVYDDQGFLINQTCYFIARDDKYLCAVLNSKLVYFYVRQIASNLGSGAFRWIKQYVEKLPIPINPDSAILKQIEDLASKVLDLSHELQNEYKYKEKEEIIHNLDNLIYKLYGLSENEIKLIETELARHANNDSIGGGGQIP